MRVLVTRPQREASHIARELQARGHDAVVAPLVTIAMLPPPADIEPRLRACQAVLLTSSNGARALAAATRMRSRPIYAVGQATAAAAEGLGFATVFSADRDAGALAALVRRMLVPADGKLLHVSGEDVAVDLGALMARHGFEVDRVELYAAQPVPELPPDAAVALANEILDAAFFFSPRTAATFASLVDKAGLDERLRSVMAIAISDAALAPVARLGWRRTKVASAPTRAAMLDALDDGPSVAVRPGKEAEMSDAAKAAGDTLEPVAPPSTGASSAMVPPPPAVRSPDPRRRGLGVVATFVTGLVAAIVVAAACVGLLRFQPDLIRAVLPLPTQPAGNSGDIAAATKAQIDAQAADLAARLATAQRQSEARLAEQQAALAGKLAAAEAQLATARTTLADLARAVGELQGRMAPPANAGDLAQLREAQASAMRDLQSLQAIIGQLQAQATALDSRLRQGGNQGVPPAIVEELGPLKLRLEKIEAEAQRLLRAVGAAADTAGHAADKEAVDRELARLRGDLEKQLAALRETAQQAGQRGEAIEAELRQRFQALATARGEADRRAADSARAAAAIALSARLRQQVETGASFANELELLKPLAAQEARFAEIMKALQPLAAGGTPSRTVLRLEFPAMAKAALALDVADDSTGERALAALRNLVSVRRVGADVPGDSVEARLARAEALLEAGDVASAASLVKQLQGKPAEAASPWLKRAEAHVAAQSALDRLALLGVALLGPAQ